MAATHYSVGTVSVAANGTVVTGTGTLWLAASLLEGDIFAARGLTVSIASIGGNGQITLTQPWPGAALSNAVYEVRRTPDSARVLSASLEAVQSFEGSGAKLALLNVRGDGALAVDPQNGAPEVLYVGDYPVWTLANSPTMAGGAPGLVTLMKNMTETAMNPGATIAGENLRYSNIIGTEGPTPPTGSVWRCLGRSTTLSAGGSVTVFAWIS